MEVLVAESEPSVDFMDYAVALSVNTIRPIEAWTENYVYISSGRS